MFRLTIKELAAKKLRILATALAVIIGVAFLAGTLTLTDTVMSTFDGLLAKADEGTDVYVRGESPLALGFGEARPRVDADLVDTIRAVDGVDDVAIRVTGYAQILDHDGKAVGNPQSGVMGMNWSTVDELNPFRLSEGVAPTGGDQIVIDRHSANEADFHVGDHTTLLTGAAPRDVTIVGIAKFGDADSPGGSAMVLLDDTTAQALLAEPGQVDGIAVIAEDGVSSDSLVAALQPVVGESNEAITGAQLTKEDQDNIHRQLAGFGTFMTIFAAIAMFVGAFIINNTFSIIVSQRTKELALLRAIGASGRQVRRAVLVEAAIVGTTASVIGLVAGIGVAKALQALLAAVGVDIPSGATVVTSGTVITALTVGFLVTVVSAVMPARRASKVPPIAALRDVAQDRSAVSRRRIVTGTVLLLGSLALLLAGLGAKDVMVVGLGAVGMFIAVSVFGPVVARPVGSALGYPMAKLRGMPGVIARQNATRNPKRTAKTAASLMIGVGLVSFITIFAASTKASGAGSFRNDFHGTAVVDSGAYDASSGLSPDLAAAISSQPGVHTVAEERITHVEIDGTPVELFRAFNADALGTLFDLGTVQGDLAQLGADGIAVKAGEGPDAPQLGDIQQVTFTTGTKPFVVRAIYDDGAMFVGDQFVDLAAFAGTVPTTLDARLYVDADDLSVLDTVADPYPTAKVMSTEEYIDQQSGKIDTMLMLINALLGLAVLIALLGIANTLALSIHERRRELGLLRAVGMSRAQVRSSVRWESVIIALFGTALGMGIGVFLGWATMKALSGEGIDQFVVPTGSMATIAAIAAFAGIGAALMPARRAARVDVLKAVAST